MAEFHFVEDYERHVQELMKKHPLDEAMSLAVGGGYERIGNIASDVLLHFGLADGQNVFDFGCGSGRVATALARKVDVASYTGTDVVQALLDYGDSKTPANFKFVCHREISLPVADASIDFGFAFSVFTHLLQTECYAYLQEFTRALRPGGKLVVSFLELAEPRHWSVFLSSLGAAHLNTFVERNQWQVWAGHAGLDVVEIVNGSVAISDAGALGQSIIVFQKPV